MINNTKSKILVGCLALLLVLSVGYALFSDTITINGTAKAKGDFDITATCTPGLTDAGFINATAFGDALKTDNNYKNDSCVVDGNKVTYSAELSQPSAVRNFTVKMTNSGTIDAALDFNNIKWTFKSCEGNYDTGEFADCTTDNLNEMNDGRIVALEKSDGTNFIGTTENINELLGFFDLETEFLILKPGESMYYVVSAEWYDHGAEAYGSGKHLFKEETTLEFPFKQQTNN